MATPAMECSGFRHLAGAQALVSLLDWEKAV
jgi:hypothetical protein